ncbi:hypothetical protein L6R29_11570 [Myxococcota bacterium]|nr:hypothetical protein [Myxococcota bacterium]
MHIKKRFLFLIIGFIFFSLPSAAQSKIVMNGFFYFLLVDEHGQDKAVPMSYALKHGQLYKILVKPWQKTYFLAYQISPKEIQRISVSYRKDYGAFQFPAGDAYLRYNAILSTNRILWIGLPKDPTSSQKKTPPPPQPLKEEVTPAQTLEAPAGAGEFRRMTWPLSWVFDFLQLTKK